MEQVGEVTKKEQTVGEVSHPPLSGCGQWAESPRFLLYSQYAENPDWFVLSERPSEELPDGAINASVIQVRV